MALTWVEPAAFVRHKYRIRRGDFGWPLVLAAVGLTPIGFLIICWRQQRWPWEVDWAFVVPALVFCVPCTFLLIRGSEIFGRSTVTVSLEGFEQEQKFLSWSGLDHWSWAQISRVEAEREAFCDVIYLRDESDSLLASFALPRGVAFTDIEMLARAEGVDFKRLSPKP